HLEITSLETTRNRIFTIAEIHEILYQQQSLKKIPFHEFVKRLIGILSSNKDQNGHPKVKLQLNSLDLNINQAVPLGLMLNEILSRLRNGNGNSLCKSVQLSLDVVRSKEINVNFDIQHLNPKIKKQITQPANYLPATLIKVLCSQLKAEFVHKKNNGIDSFNIYFTKEEKLGSASNI
ncbi:hypothetical protein NC796_04810, partial [Aliifodinibius sp. S!AR15-10]|uniref:histidine kinase dimerization/phosphoacceptor domain -containing protein n=1 Tax=Aliifodinibius sp. S!AR15-10 TaxID=2950437 RepID=UPI00285A0100